MAEACSVDDQRSGGVDGDIERHRVPKEKVLDNIADVGRGDLASVEYASHPVVNLIRHDDLIKGLLCARNPLTVRGETIHESQTPAYALAQPAIRT
jgi:hypothetical protein